MNVFFDERCLTTPELEALLVAWRQVSRFTQTNGRGVILYLDSWAVRAPDFLRRFNLLKPEYRVLFKPVLFGNEFFSDWRKDVLSGEAFCRLATEVNPIQNSGVCEAYEHRKINSLVLLFGDTRSSFVGRQTVEIEKVTPPEPSLIVACGTDIVHFTRIGVEWDSVVVHYDTNSSRPPRDNETALGHFHDRFERVGRFERNGRRQVYRELASGRLFYVDNLHFGQSAHLEVFDSDEAHIGIATLDAAVDESRKIAGREIKW